MARKFSLRLLSRAKQATDAAVSDDFLRSILESSNDAIQVLDLEGRVLYANPGGQKLLGDEGRTRGLWLELWIEDDRGRAAAAMEAALRKGVGRFQACSTGGEERKWWDVFITPIRDQRGHILQLLAISRDVTEHRQAEETRSRLAAIVESSDDAIISKDLNGIITSWNGAAERMYGYTAPEVIGRHVSLLAPPERKGDVDHLLERIRRGERVEHFETVRITKDGRRFDASVTISPVRDSDGHIIGASKITRDVTQRKRAEEVLRSAEKLAATGRMAATIAHEINNPLESLTNLLYLIETADNLDPQARSYAHMAQEEISRVAKLARQTLAFYRETSVAGPVSCAAIVESLLELYQHKLQARNITVDTRLDTWRTFEGSSSEIRQVFANIIGNAIDALSPGGRLRVHVCESHQWRGPRQRGIRITVADTGHGMPPEVRQRVFEPFFTTKGEQGTGLGLWVALGIVRKYGGSIRARSSQREGRSGTCFSMFFPFAQRWSGAGLGSNFREAA